MDYKELANQLRQRFLNDISGHYQMHSDICRDCNKAATAITDLLARAEAAEKERDSLREVLDMYGGEDGITAMLKQKEAAEARVHDLETTHRVEMCEDGYDCVELGKVRRKLEKAEARAEKAEREKDAAVKTIETIMGAQKYCTLCKNMACKNSNTTEAACKPMWNGLEE